MKKIVAIFLLLSVLLATACGAEPTTTTPTTTTPTATTPTATTPMATTPATTTPTETSPLVTTPSETPSESIPNPVTDPNLAYDWTTVSLKVGETFDWTFSVLEADEIRFDLGESATVEVVSTVWEEWDGYYATATVTIRAIGTGETSITAQIGEQHRVIAVQTAGVSLEDLPESVPAPAADPTLEYDSTIASVKQGETFDWTFSVLEAGEIRYDFSQPGIVEVVSTVWEEWDGYYATATVTLRAIGAGGTDVIAKIGEQSREIVINTLAAEGYTDLILPQEDLLPTGDSHRLTVMLNLDSAKTGAKNFSVTVDSSNPDVISIGGVTVDDPWEGGETLWSAWISVDFNTLSAGDTTVTITSVEDPSVVLTLDLCVLGDDVVNLGEGDLCQSITVENGEGEVYKDDTTVTYTVTTNTSVDKLEFIQLERFPESAKHYLQLIANRDSSLAVELHKLVIDADALDKGVIYDESTKTAYSATREEKDGQYVWTVQWDLGNTAVRYVEISAYNGEKVQTNYVKLNIHYPVFDAADGLVEVVKYWISLNLDEPLLFDLNLSDMTEEQLAIYAINPSNVFRDEVNVLLGLPAGREFYADTPLATVEADVLNDARFDAHVIYRDFNKSLMPYGMVAVPELSGTLQQLKGKTVLPTHNGSARTYAVDYPVMDEIRALIAYENGYTIDEELFPYAHSMLERGSAIIESIIEDGMTDFEKVRAIYTYLFGIHYAGYEEYPVELVPDTELYYAFMKTAYGLLNGYSGDCMGWSGSFFLLCNMAGVPCATVDCQATQGGQQDSFVADHRLTLVRLGEEYYYVDAYWSYQHDETMGDYWCMLMTTEMASELYTWRSEKNFGPPVFDGTNYLVDSFTGELLNP